MCYKTALRAKGVRPIPPYHELRVVGGTRPVAHIPDDKPEKKAA